MHENPVITNNKCQVRLKWCAWGMDYSESLLQFSQIHIPLTMGAVHSSCAHFKHTWHWIHRSRGLLSAKASPQTRHGQMSSSESSEQSCLHFVRFLFPLVLGRFLFDPFPPPCFLDLLPVEVPGWGSLSFLGLPMQALLQWHTMAHDKLNQCFSSLWFGPAGRYCMVLSLAPGWMGMINVYDCPSAREVTLNDMVKFDWYLPYMISKWIDVLTEPNKSQYNRVHIVCDVPYMLCYINWAVFFVWLVMTLLKLVFPGCFSILYRQRR